ncbi:peptidoglycan editing factor PgeF [Pannonibacter carbonis]|uniref:peptidoglycan editing factor PgeF n=1 Tax=Pannonibacter carbonis TaxID=2067569 RepID=UPI0018E57CAF|nr:peptidoglycan editing factor PgeF [Pannonibacter carbonis]
MITSDLLAQSGGIRHGFFTRQGGVSGGIYESLNIGLGSDDDRAHVLENRARIAGKLAVAPERLVSPYQVHSPDVITVEAPFAADADRRADALVTATPGLALGISTADCGPVLFADLQARVIGAAHAGWRGALTGVLDNTIAAMEALGAERGRIRAVLGPTISRTAYEVGPEFHARFLEEAEGSGVFFSPSQKPEHFMFDLPAFILARLAAAGVGAAESLGLCTYANEARFFSYRRTTHRKEPDYGRLMSAIVIEGA